MAQNQRELVRQCTLKKGTTSQVVFIEDKFSKVGSYVQIKDLDKPFTWDDRWEVIWAADTPKLYAYVRAHERDYLTQRKASDI